jgi:NADH-quinone oxidoreductase subunit I
MLIALRGANSTFKNINKRQDYHDSERQIMTIKDFFKTIFFVEIAQGMALTMKRMFTPAVTRQYPIEKRPTQFGFRGLHGLAKFPSGKIKCVGCGLCAAYCPSKCIHIHTSEGVGPNQKIVDRYEIDVLRCVFCGFCVEACPYGAIVMTEHYEYADTNRESFYHTKEMLLANWDNYMNQEKAQKYYDFLWRPKAVDFTLPTDASASITDIKTPDKEQS